MAVTARGRRLRPGARESALAGLLVLLLLVLPLGAGAAPAAWVELDDQPVLEIRVAAGAQSPADLAGRLNRLLRDAASDPAVSPADLTVSHDPPYWQVVQRLPSGRSRPWVAVDERAARSFGVPQQQLAELYRDKLQAAISQYRIRNHPRIWLLGTGLALLVLVAYLTWVRWQLHWVNRLRQRLAAQPPELRIGDIELMDAEQMGATLQLLVALLHWGLLLLISYLLIPLLLGLFPPTQILAAGLRSQILAVLKGAASGVVDAIPALAMILLIAAVCGAVVRMSNSWFRAIERGRIRVRGFYPEWARPTSRIVALFVVFAGVVVAFPFVPGSGSKVFQGAGLFVGVLAALGSSAVATNVISGVMLIYTRGFREGDRVEINGVIGVVEERALLVTRIRTPRQETVSIPNATMISSNVVNFNLAQRESDQPVAIATTVTIGYDVPWRRVHQLLEAAAAAVPGLSQDPAPRVYQTALNDFHISYELNASLRDVSRYRESLSDLLAAIQDQFATADVEILSPSYLAMRNGNPSTVPRPEGRGG